jgi:hypothetical protein
VLKIASSSKLEAIVVFSTTRADAQERALACTGDVCLILLQFSHVVKYWSDSSVGILSAQPVAARLHSPMQRL